LANRQAQALPLLIGTTALDLPLFFPPSKLNPLAWFGPDADKARDAYAAPATLDRNSLAALLLSIGADMTMHEPARYAARQVTAQGFPAWLYRFTYTAQSERPETMQQGHAGELPFFFDQLAARYGANTVTPADEATARAFNTYAANFVKTGNPNSPELASWPPFDPTAYDLMHFAPAGPAYTTDPRADRIRLVEQARDREQE
jgi:para-nitrobenzyl esterase